MTDPDRGPDVTPLDVWTLAALVVVSVALGVLLGVAIAWGLVTFLDYAHGPSW